jgi:cold shock protein
MSPLRRRSHKTCAQSELAARTQRTRSDKWRLQISLPPRQGDRGPRARPHICECGTRHAGKDLWLLRATPYVVGRCSPNWRAPHELRSRFRPHGHLPFPTYELPGQACGPFGRRVTPIGKGSRMRVTGTMKFFNVTKGFGFVQPDDGSKDVFVHATALEAAGIRSLNEGDKISFVLEDDRRGRGKQAAQIEKV